MLFHIYSIIWIKFAEIQIQQGKWRTEMKRLKSIMIVIFIMSIIVSAKDVFAETPASWAEVYGIYINILRSVF